MGYVFNSITDAFGSAFNTLAGLNPFSWSSSTQADLAINQIAQQSILSLPKANPDLLRKEWCIRNKEEIPALFYLENGKLRINYHTNITQAELLKLFEENPDLTVIEIAGLPIDDEVLRVIAERYPDLKKLNVSSCINLTENGFNTLATSCKKILKLHTSNLNISDGGYNQILAANPDLTEWIVASPYRENAATSIGIATLEQLSNNQKLTVFNARGAYAPEGQTRENAFISFINSCPLLQTVDIAIGWSDLTDKSLEAIANLKDIEKLDITMSSANFTAEGVSQLLQNTSSLRNFSAPDINFNFSNEQMIAILSKITSMEKFQIGGLSDIKPEVFNLFQNCQALQKLKLVNFKELDDEQLVGIINNIFNLKSLTLIGELVSGKFLNLINNSNFSSLNIQTSIDSSSWVGFNNNRLSLKKFSLSGDVQGNNTTGLFDFIKANPDLRQLYLSVAYPFSNEQLLQLENTKLVELSLQGKSNINQATMAEFIKKNPKLTSFFYVSGENGLNLMEALSSRELLKKFQVSFDLWSEYSALAEVASERAERHLEKCNIIWAYLYKFALNPQKEEIGLRNFIEENNVLNLTLDSTNLSSESLVNAIAVRPNQTTVRLMYTNLTDEGMNEILAMCKSLNLLEIYTDIITPEAVQLAKQKYPNRDIQCFYVKKRPEYLRKLEKLE